MLFLALTLSPFLNPMMVPFVDCVGWEWLLAVAHSVAEMYYVHLADQGDDNEKLFILATPAGCCIVEYFTYLLLICQY